MTLSPSRERDAALLVPFAIRVQPEREAVHVSPVGELDIATVGALRGEVEELIAAGFGRVVIDLRGLRFIGCAGLKLLRALDVAARRDGWGLALIQGPAAVRRLFALTATLDALPFASPASLPRPDARAST